MAIDSLTTAGEIAATRGGYAFISLQLRRCDSTLKLPRLLSHEYTVAPLHLTLKSYSIEVVVAEFGLCSPIPRPRSRMHVFRIARSSHVNTMRCDVAMSIPHPFARARARTFHSPLAYPFQRKQPSAPNMHVVIRLHLSPPRACPPLLAHGSYCRRHSQAVRPRCSCGLGTCTVCIATSVRRLPWGFVGLGAFSNSSMPTQHSPAPHTPVSPVSSVR